MTVSIIISSDYRPYIDDISAMFWPDIDDVLTRHWRLMNIVDLGKFIETFKAHIGIAKSSILAITFAQSQRKTPLYDGCICIGPKPTSIIAGGHMHCKPALRLGPGPPELVPPCPCLHGIVPSSAQKLAPAPADPGPARAGLGAGLEAAHMHPGHIYV